MAHSEKSFAKQAGQFLKKQLEEKGYTQEKFGDEFHVDPRTVRNWTNKGISNLDTLQEILSFFDIKLKDALLSFED